MKCVFLKKIKKGMLYSIGNITINAINFLSIPVFTRLMTTNSFGEYSVYLSYSNVIFVFIGFAIHSSLNTAKFDYKKEYSGYLKTCTLFIIGCYLFWISLISLLYLFGVNPLNYEYYILQCLFVRSLCLSLSNFYSNKCIMAFQYKRLLAVNFINIFLDFLLGAFFLIKLSSSEQFKYRVFANGIVAIVVIGLIVIQLIAPRVKVKKEYIKYGLKISLPIVPHGLSQIVLSSFDRIMIRDIIGTTEAGIYSLSYTIGSVLTIIVNSISGVWTPWFYENMNSDSIDTIREKSIYYIGAISFLSANAIMLSREGIVALAPESYSDAITLTPIVLLGIFFSLMYLLPSSIEYFYKKTKFIAIGTICAAIINVFLNWVCIEKWGYFAASYTTLFTYVLYFFFHMIIYKKLEKRQVFSTKAIIISIIVNLIATVVAIVFSERLLFRVILLSIVDFIFVVFICKRFRKTR